MKRFYFYGVVTYPPQSFQDIPKGSLGLHYIESNNEELAHKQVLDSHNKYNLYLVDIFGKKTKAPFKWYGEIKK